MLAMADTARLLEAVSLKAAILAAAERRAACWRDGNSEQATILGSKLESDWQRYRIARAQALGDPPTTKVDHPVDRFLSECCQLGSHVLTPVRDVCAAYTTWAYENGEDSITAMRLTQELERRGVERARTNRTRMYRGVVVTAFAQTPLVSAA